MSSPTDTAVADATPSRNGFDPLSLLTTDEVARLLSVSPQFVKKEYLAGRLGYVKLGKSVRFERRQVAAYVMERRSP